MELQESGSEGNRIRSLFSAMGGSLPIREIARRCIEGGVWDETTLEGIMIAGAEKRVKDALKVTTNGSGLPFAAAVGKGREAVWRQRELFSYEDYVTKIGEGVEALGADHAKLRAWQGECRARFGTAPSIPDLVN